MSLISHVKTIVTNVVGVGAVLKTIWSKLLLYLADLAGVMRAVFVAAVTGAIILFNTIIDALEPLLLAFQNLLTEVTSAGGGGLDVTFASGLINVVGFVNWVVPLDTLLILSVAYLAFKVACLIARALLSLIPTIG